MTFADVLRRANIRMASGHGSAQGSFGDPTAKFSTHSFGCHFVEVTWQAEIARLRINRVVTVIDAGHILNPLAGRNQIEGAVVMGIGMALGIANFTELDGFTAEARRSHAMGLTGAMCIHPNQVAVLNQCFGVSDEAIAAAHAILAPWNARPAVCVTVSAGWPDGDVCRCVGDDG